MLNMPLMKDNIVREDIDCLIEFLQNSDIFTQNKKVKELEQKWSQWLGVKYSVFVNSGSSANFISMAIIRELYGSGEIIVPALTWESDIASVIAAGHVPVFVDINLKNLAMNEDMILDKITDKTKAVFLTHILGFNGLSDRLLNELNRRNILLIEDVCESHGATFKDKKLGTFGLASNFSFYYAHHMSTIEGGMICTDDEEFYQYSLMFRSHGMLRESTNDTIKKNYVRQYPDLNPKFIFTVPGYNMRSTELNAVIGLNQLKRLDSNNERRKENFRTFLYNLDKDKYYTDFDLEGSVNYAFVLLMKDPNKDMFNKLCSSLDAKNVEYRIGTSGGGNQLRQPYIRKLYPDIDITKYPVVDMIHFYGMYIGNYPELEKDKILKLCDFLNKID